MEKGIYKLICLTFVFRTVISQSSSDCFTPNELNGECINVKNCPLLRALLENQRKNSTITNFLRNSMCGYEGRDPKVCCPLESEPPNNSNNGNFGTTTTTRTSTSWPTSNNYETVLSAKLPSQMACGHSNVTSNRVVGGSPAELGAWPWMTSLGYRDQGRQTRNYQWLCGGALISERYVLTAAHCTVGIGNRRLVVARLGDLNLDPNVNDGAEPIDIPIARILTHKEYNAREYTNDIALLKLENNARFGRLIQPICLPILPHHKNNLFVDTRPFVAGWGSTSFRGPSTNVLMQVPIPVLDNSECKRAFVNNKKTVIDERVLCAGYLSGGKDACQGDSGGPLMWPSGKQYYLVGIVSFGYKCAEPGYPGVYTRVSAFVDWVANNMNES